MKDGSAGVSPSAEGRMAKLTHLDAGGEARMVDVGAKRTTRRSAVAEGVVRFNRAAFRALRENRLAKGDALAVARLAGIQAAKRTDEWVPLCHSIPLDHLAVDIDLDEEQQAARVTVEARARWTTGVEMEALVAVSASCLALYDMAKALDRSIRIEQVGLVAKRGGRSGAWQRDAAAARRGGKRKVR
jgi:cyclic pyranopterin phosphate synthase